MSFTTDTKPYGNSRSLVPEISGRGVNGEPVKPCSHGEPAKIINSTILVNHSIQDLKDTGKS